MILFLKSIEKNEIEITSSFRVLDKYNVLFHPTLILVFGEENEEINDFNSIEDINKKNEFNNISIKNIRFVKWNLFFEIIQKLALLSCYYNNVGDIY